MLRNQIKRSYPYRQYFRNTQFSPAYPQIQHTPLTHSIVNKYKVIGFFRSPTSRILSAYNYFEGKYIYTFKEYAKRSQGSVTKQLAGQEYGTACLTYFSARSLRNNIFSKRCNINLKPNLELALARLNKFDFIGITDYYVTSLCLFSKRFSLPLSHYHFIEMRRTKKKLINYSHFKVHTIHTMK